MYEIYTHTHTVIYETVVVVQSALFFFTRVSLIYNLASNSCKGKKKSSACTQPHMSLIMLFSEINNEYALSEMCCFCIFILLYCIFHYSLLSLLLFLFSPTLTRLLTYKWPYFDQALEMGFWVHASVKVFVQVRYLINSLFALLVLLSFLLDFLPLFNLINQLEKVTEVKDHRLSLGIHAERQPERHRFIKTKEVERRRSDMIFSIRIRICCISRTILQEIQSKKETQ